MATVALTEDALGQPVYPEITEEHLKIAQRVARISRWRFGGFDVSDLEWVAIGGLTRAWRTWRGNGSFEIFAQMQCRYAILSYMNASRLRSRIAPMVSLSSPANSDSDVSESESRFRRLFDTLECPTSVADLVEAQDELAAITAALSQEEPIVGAAVMRLDSDAAIARKFGRKDGNSIRQYRERFLRDFQYHYENGVPFKSTGRRRHLTAV